MKLNHENIYPSAARVILVAVGSLKWQSVAQSRRQNKRPNVMWLSMWGCVCRNVATTRKWLIKQILLTGQLADTSSLFASLFLFCFWLSSTWKFRQLTPFSMLAKKTTTAAAEAAAGGDNNNSSSSSSSGSSNIIECVN